MDYAKLSEMEKDIIREVGNVGTGNAATALSKLLNKHIEIIIPETKLVPINEFAKEFGGPEKVVTSTYLDVSGDIEGEALFIFPVDSAEKIVDIMCGQEIGTSKIMDEDAQSAFKEMSNIVTGAYLNSLANMMDGRILPDIPHITTDMLQSILDFIFAKVSNHSDQILCIKTQIEIKETEVEGFFIVIFDNPSMDKLLSTLKKLYGE